jgi:FMN phosphatase YigB (HAD superfamily)
MTIEHSSDVAVIDNHPVVSFDLWDTLIRRRCHPDEIKLRLARYIWLHAREVNSISPSPVEIYWMRKSSEDSVATEDWEYKFSNAIENLLKKLSITQEHILNANSLEEIELYIENNSTYLDLDNLAFLKRSRSNRSLTLLVSDFYHGAAFLKALLQKKGIHEYFDHIYSSSDYLLNKRSGSVFDLVRKNHNLVPSEWLHIGDNQASDHAVPLSKGLKALLVKSTNHELETKRLNIAFIDHVRSSRPIIHTKRLRSIANADLPEDHNIANASPEAHDLYRSGFHASPIFAGLILRVIEDALATGVGHTFFFSREGIFFEELLNIAKEEDVYDLNDAYPTSSVLRVSRAATFAASLREASLGELMRMWNLYSYQSVDAFSLSLNLNREFMAQQALEFGMNSEEAIKYPWTNASFIKLFSSPAVQAHLEAKIIEQRNKLVKYLASQHIDDSERGKLHIVDIGWRGTIQDNLAYLLQNTNLHGTYLGLDTFLNPQPSNCSKMGFICDNNSKEPESHLDLGDVAILEFISNAQGGSVTGYDEYGKPKLKVVAGEEAVLTTDGKIIQHGIKTGVQRLLRYAKSHGLTSRDFLDTARGSLANLKQRPATALSDAYNRLHHNESFGAGTSNAILNLKTLCQGEAKSLEELHFRISVIEQSCRWRQALIHSSEFKRYVEAAKPIDLLAMSSTLYRHACHDLLGKKAIIFMPQPIRGSGGHRTILNFAKGLAAVSCEVEIQLEEFGQDVDYIYEEISESNITVTQWWQPGSVCDIAIATIGHSPEFVASSISAHSKYYFVQDHEASFNPMGDTYINIQNSYAHGLIPLCIGAWMPHLLEVQYGIGSFYAGLGVDTKVYKALANHRSTSRIAFLYQPEKHRRMTFHCLKALRCIREVLPEVEIISFGSIEAPPSGIVNKHLGLVNSLYELNLLYNQSTVGLCISLTNPSRIPFEMMATGCVPVDVYKYNNLFDYPNGTAMLAYQDHRSIAKALELLILNAPETTRRSKNCIDYALYRSLNWEVDSLVNSVAYSHCTEDFRYMSKPSPRYTDTPVYHEIGPESKSALRFCEWERFQSIQ